MHSRNKILLIEPPFYRLYKDTYSISIFPLSLGYLSGVIREKTNWEVMVYNADFYPHNEAIKLGHLINNDFDNYLYNLKNLSNRVWKEVKTTILEYNPSVVGISAKSPNFTSACIVAKLIKEINKAIIVIIGGSHPSLVESEALNYPHFDIAVKGEGENTIVELLNAINDRTAFDAIRGIIYRKNDKIIGTPPRGFIENLDSLPFPHEIAPEVLKDYNQYPITAFRSVFTSRGCPFNCSFCGSHKIWGHRARFRSSENIIREIKGLQKMGVKHIRFDDDTFGANNFFLNDLCNALIENCRGLKWSCETHVKLVNDQAVNLMKKAGCSSIQIGIESGNNNILKEICKNITIEEAYSACKIIKKYNINLETFFIVGFPQETEETLNDTIAAMKKVKSNILQYSIFTPYPGTKLFEYCRDHGLIGNDFDISLYNHQSSKNYFCINISPKKFIILASRIGKMVDRKNSLNRIKQLFSLDTYRKMQEYGTTRSFQKLIKLFIGK